MEHFNEILENGENDLISTAQRENAAKAKLND
jgi:uncharacterized membrane protein